MRISFWKLIPAGLLLMAVPGFALAHPRTTSAKKHYHASVKHSSVKHASVKNASMKHRRGWHLRAHRETAAVVMPAERATQIQTALIKQGYLTGEPTGTWDAQTVAAMQKLQADNGWQTKLTPDSRALIKLGLGPKDAAGDPSDGGGTNHTQDVAQTPPQ